jgi:hypothetical protein
VKSSHAPRSAGRQWAPQSSSIVIGAPAGTSGTSGITSLCRRSVSMGRSMPAQAATPPESGPQAITARSVWIVPAAVRTPRSRPPAMSKPSARQPVTTVAPDDFAKPIVTARVSMKPSPARNRAWSTSGAT